MAKISESKSTGASDAITLLKKDHAMVQALAKEFRAAESDEQEAIAEHICNLLTVHTSIEEEIFYPAAREGLPDEEGEDLLNEAEVEHAAAKELIAKIESMSSDDDLFAATVNVLMEYVQHHVEEEEDELFPRCKKSKEMDLNAIGQALASRRRELLEELGMDRTEEGEAITDTTPNARAGKSHSEHARSSTRTRGH
jgi:hemerythrin superfamily protein